MWVTRRSTRARQRILSACFRSIATAHRRISLSSPAATGVGVSRDDVEDRAGGSPISFRRAGGLSARLNPKSRATVTDSTEGAGRNIFGPSEMFVDGFERLPAI